ncbi:hypothetical protein Aph01nite_77440 [Acrocarpospora phusangensis]|uniref:Helicase HerA central domain-containing protein n=1 Tax=Acrocarpospora phusangensis TaxID=1070424 RepID=A0A919UQ43_9ACTN|nr:helicase HerA-like domain-containing protein [Acrocarpospora phusangensis]GIH29434.1 hypothetical protein Aph01nite_77440 [Acrocarpospora phusangensis]
MAAVELSRHAGENVPRLLMSLLERRYLADFQPSYWRSDLSEDSVPMLGEVRRLGRPRQGEDTTAAMAHALTAGHWHGHAMIMALHGTGSRHRIHLGGRRLAGVSRGSTGDFLQAQASVLRAHLSGLELGGTGPLGQGDTSELSAFLRSAPALALITGIPSPRAGSTAFQSLDRLVNAVGDRNYAVVVVAEPLDLATTDATLDLCRSLKRDIHSYVRQSLTEAHGDSDSTTTSRTETDNRLSPLTASLAGLAAFATVIGMFTEKMGGLAQPAFILAGLANAQRSTTVSTGRTETTTRSVGIEVLDAEAEAAERLLQRHIDRIEQARSAGWWRTSVYLAADSDGTLDAVASALRGICAGDATALEPLRVIRPAPWLVRGAALGGRTLSLTPALGKQGHPLGPAFESLGTCVTSDELAVLMNLPTREIPGLPMRDIGEFAQSAPSPTGRTVELGRLLDPLGRELQPVTLTADALNRHVFISGMTGYGKTTTAMNLLTQAYTEFGVPFLVIEPVKAEYRELARHPALRGRLRVYSIGADAALPLRLNPFTPVPGVPLARHIDLLKAVFNAAFPMYAGMPYVLEEAMLELYTERGWDLDTSFNDSLGSPEDLSALTPTLGDLYDKIEVVLDRRQYAREVHQNMGAALRSRLRSLMLGGKGMALNTNRSVALDELFSRPCVVELRNLGDDEEKAFIMALLLSLLYEYAETRTGKGLRHLTLIEEAHRLLRPARGPASSENADSQAKAVTMFTDMLAEMRAYGEGFVIADQIPTKLAPEIVKNSNVKILHRLVSLDDRAVVAGTVNLTDAQSRHLATLPPGEAVVHDSRIGSAVLVRMHEPATAGEAAPLVGHDLTYLHRDGGCRQCPSPCTAFGTAERQSVTTDAALSAFFAGLLTATAEDLWPLWKRWRDTAGDAAYCMATRSAHRWLTTIVEARALAVGSPDLPPAERLRRDRAARQFARLCAIWCDSPELTPKAATRYTDVQAALNQLLTQDPPRELPGCATCPSRCHALPLIAPHLASLGPTIASRATSAMSPAARARGIAKAAENVLPLSSGALHCLVVNATADLPVDLTDLLPELKTAGMA